MTGGHGWWAGRIGDSTTIGAFPASYVEADTRAAFDSLLQEYEVSDIFFYMRYCFFNMRDIARVVP